MIPPASVEPEMFTTLAAEQPIVWTTDASASVEVHVSHEDRVERLAPVLDEDAEKEGQGKRMSYIWARKRSLSLSLACVLVLDTFVFSR